MIDDLLDWYSSSDDDFSDYDYFGYDDVWEDEELDELPENGG